ncbi:MAG: kelch repeat-containing protein [Anaerolineae bacterium]
MKFNLTTNKSMMLLSLLALVLALVLAPVALAPGGTWTTTGRLGTARTGHTATPLFNGHVLVAGGQGRSGDLTGAEIYDPASGAWTGTGSLNTARRGHTATLLPRGHVLAVGGNNASGDLASAELFDGPTPTAVSLLSFDATPGRRAIRLDWETASEIDNVGFNLYRQAAQGEPVRLNAALIPSQNPGSTTGATYTFLDDAAEPGVTYYYWLEDVDVYGWATLHGPVRAIIRP